MFYKLYGHNDQDLIKPGGRLINIIFEHFFDRYIVSVTIKFNKLVQVNNCYNLIVQSP